VQVQALRLEHHQQRAANATVQAKCDEFVKACLVKWSQPKRVVVVAAPVRVLLRHAHHARAKVALSRKFRTQLKFRLVSTLVKHFD
jgi:hypothetical protein